MSVISKPLITAKYASNSENTEYTATGVRTIIDKFTGYNGTAGVVTLTVKLVANAGTAGASNIIETKSLAAGETYSFPGVVGHCLEAGGFISVIAGAVTSIVIRATGREVS